MAIKKTKKLNNSKDEVYYFNALLENMDSKIDVILEGYQVLDKKIENLRGDMNEKFKEVDYKFDIVFQKFDEVDKKFDIVFQKFDEVDKKFDEVTSGLHFIHNDLNKKVGRDEFVVVEKRVFALEKLRLS